jgi:hypothetical protein
MWRSDGTYTTAKVTGLICGGRTFTEPPCTVLGVQVCGAACMGPASQYGEGCIGRYDGRAQRIGLASSLSVRPHQWRPELRDGGWDPVKLIVPTRIVRFSRTGLFLSGTRAHGASQHWPAG